MNEQNQQVESEEFIYQPAVAQLLFMNEGEEAVPVPEPEPVSEPEPTNPEPEAPDNSLEESKEEVEYVFDQVSPELRAQFEKETRLPYDKFLELVEQYNGSEVKYNKQQEELQKYGVIAAREQMANYWGVPYEEARDRIELVKKHFGNKLSEAELAKYDTHEGLDYLYLKAHKSLQKDVPQYNKGSSSPRVTNDQVPMFTKTQLQKMPEKEYRARQAEILKAFQLGLVADK